MKIAKIWIAGLLMPLLLTGCQEEDDTYSLDYLTPPSGLGLMYDITQDNSGLVTLYPNAAGAALYRVFFGDVEDEEPTEYHSNQVITHHYQEGVYTVKLVAVGISGLTSELEEQLTVSFQPPQNLQITIENDPAVSRQVNLSATADLVTIFDFYFGDVENEEPTHALPGEVISHLYAEAGEYSIRVTARGGGEATLDTTFNFTVTEFSEPLSAAPLPPARVDADVISIFSDAYSNLPGTDFNPNWGQATQVSIVTLEGDSTLQYGNLNYQGTQFGSTVDASEMEFLHIDMWTMDASQVSIFPISLASGEKSVDLPVVPGEWQQYDIPLSDFTDQGLSVNDLHQFKFEGTEGSTIFLDNLYFYKESGAQVVPVLPLDFESPTIQYTWNDFDGGSVTVIDNPQPSGINTSSRVAQMVKGAGQTWGGSWIALEEPIDFTTMKTMKMKVFSPRTGARVLLKVENMENSGIFFETEVSTTVANAWEELTFDYSAINASESYQKVVIIFDNGTNGDGSTNFTFLFDDIEQPN
jgi:hypothetical protein